MDKNMENKSSLIEYGRWVPVTDEQVGFNLPTLPSNQPMRGPDGAIYAVGPSAPQLGSIPSNAGNAVPTPSSIIQMPPIVQPIALVPYTTQNQPMLQYDPYSRPVEPEGTPLTPVYVKKAYKGISVFALLAALAVLVLFLVFKVVAFQADSTRIAFTMSGLDFIKTIPNIFTKGTGTNYANYIVANKASDDLISKIITYALPFIALLIIVFFALLVIKYLVKFAANKTPRSFSVLAFLNIILCILMFVGLFLLTNAEVEVADRGANLKAFFGMEATHATVMWKWTLLLALIVSIVLFIVPFFAKKNAFKVDKDDLSHKTYILNDE